MAGVSCLLGGAQPRAGGGMKLQRYGMADPNHLVALEGGKVYRARLVNGQYALTANGAFLGFVNTVPQAQDRLASYARLKANRKRLTA